MAIIKPLFEMTGSVAGFSFYKRYGSDKLIMRTKGGAKKFTIRKSPKFKKLRAHFPEWAASVKMSRVLCSTMYSVKHLADFNVSATMNGLSKKMMAPDTVHPIGQRSILLSECRYMLDDFQLNKVHTFASILRVTPSWEIKRETMEAKVNIPYINTNLHLANPYNYPFFRIITILGIASDMVFDVENNKYAPTAEEMNSCADIQCTDWYSTNRVIESQELILQFEEYYYMPGRNDFSLILSIGVEFGKPDTNGQPLPVKHAGGARVLGVR
jgi:hypothetical protein